jgi:hypothetical protein
MLKTIITQTPQSTQDNRTLNPKHLKELTQKRGLDTRWVEANCFSVDAKVASDHLGYTAQSDGILLRGDNLQEQFKPDKPWGSTDGKKT